MNKQIYKLKTGICLLLLCICHAGAVKAQAPDLMWATKIGGTGTEYSSDIVVDAVGNTYIAGYFASPTDFDPLGGTNAVLSSNGGNDAFISKMDQNGHLVWVKKIGNTGSSGTEAASALALDDSGNVYVTGYFNSTADFNPGTGPADTFFMTRAGSNDIFVLKLDNNGDFIWATSMGGTGNDRGLAMDVDKAGNAYITGVFASTAYFSPSDTLITNGGIDVFVCRVNNSGDLAWVKKIGGGAGDQGNGITVDDLGDLYTVGQFTGDTLNLGGTITLTGGNGNLDGYIARMDTSGNFIWAGSFGGKSGGDRGEDVVSDNAGFIYITGGFRDTADFDPGPGTYTLISTPNRNLAADPTAPQVDEIFILKLDTTGNFIWAKRHGGPQADHGQSITIDGTGSLYILGDFADTIMIDTFRLASNGSTDVHIIKMDTTGSILWAGHMGGSSLDHGNSLAADAFGNIHVTGRYQSHLNTDFDPGPGIHVMPTTTNAAGTSGTIDAFVMRMYACINVAGATISGPDSICPGYTYTYSVGPIPGAISYEWDFPATWIVSGSGHSRTVTVDGNTGIINVAAYGLCDTAEMNKTIVRSMPPLQITVNEDVLGTASDHYLSWQWYKDGDSISGATNPTYTVSENAAYSVVVTGPDGCTDSASYTVNNVSVSTIPDGGHISVYPNPATNLIYIDATTDIASVHIKGLDGISIIRHTLSGRKNVINISALVPGVYLLEVTNHSGTLVRMEKIVKTDR